MKFGDKVTLIPVRGGFTVQDPVTRRKIGHVESAYLRDVTFRVWQSGRKRHVAGSPFQHAFIDGRLAESAFPGRGNTAVKVAYNPAKNDSFVAHLGYQGRPPRVKTAVAAKLTPEGITGYGVRG